MTLVQRAKWIARQAHAGQFRRDGVTPYIKHPEAVAKKLSRESEEVIAAAWLHDVIKDSNNTPRSLRQLGVPMCVVTAVCLLTKDTDEGYVTYLSRIKTNEMACKVKIADMLCNLGDEPTAGQVRKYAKALLVLLGE